MNPNHYPDLMIIVRLFTLKEITKNSKNNNKH